MPLSITYPSDDYQSSVHHNIYSPPQSIPQLEYPPVVNLQPQQAEFPQLDSGLTVLVFKQELKTVSYHKLYDILKQHQHEVNEIRAEKIARVANPLALVAQQQPVYHLQTHPTHYTQNFSTKSQQAATRNIRKATVNTLQPIYDQEPSMVDEDDETSKDKEIDKLMALISLSFKKIYKPTNKNIQTSSNTSRVNQDNSPRINRNDGYENQRSQQAATRNRRKATVNTLQPIYDQEPSMVDEDDETSKDKEIDKLMALISLSFKKIYKPTNNNLRTSLNISRANQDNSSRINKNDRYENQRIGNVAGAMETVSSTVVQKFGIQCYNCKEFGHVARECQKPKREKDATYHRENMLFCKQEEARIQLNAEQADWSDDTDDDELDDQELEAHYMYMAQLQQVSLDAADSGPIFDDEPLKKLVEIVLFIINSGCSKHMTGNLKLLINFVEKKSTCFIYDLKGNDLLTGSRRTDLYLITLQDTNCPNPICLMAKVTSSQAWLWHRRLSHFNFDTINLLSKNNIVAEAIATACFTQNRSLVIPRHKKTPYHIINDQKPSVKFFHIFGSLCYIVRDGENIDKMKEKGNLFMLISTNCLRWRQINSVLTSLLNDSNNVKELDLLFSPMFDELLNGSSKVVTKSSAVSAPDAPNQRQHHTTPLNIHTTPASTCQAPPLVPIVISFENINQAETYAENDQVADDEFINIFSTPVQDQGETSSRHVDSSNMHTFYQRYPSEHRWTKDHPLEQVIGNPSQSVRTRRQLESDAEMCMFALTVSRTEPKNNKESMADSAWIESMQEELHQFDRLDV
nr:Gag-Pol polyprotein [Tanacetum cinerariifolium]